MAFVEEEEEEEKVLPRTLELFILFYLFLNCLSLGSHHPGQVSQDSQPRELPVKNFREFRLRCRKRLRDLKPMKTRL